MIGIDMSIGLRNLIFFQVCIILFVGCSGSINLEADLVDVTNCADSLLDKTSDYLVVFGDIQVYTANDQSVSLYQESIDWIVKQIQGGINICSVLEVGDITWNNKPSQWELFRNNTMPLYELVPYYACTGNHDYNWDDKSIIHDRGSTLINDYAHFPLVDSGIVAYYEDKSLENYVSKLNLSDRKLYLMVLEFGVRKEVLQWAKNYIQSHKDEAFILMTHEWLSENGERISTKGCYASYQLQGVESFSTPEEVWKELVAPSDNIVCVLCGHNGFWATLISDNNNGKSIPQVLFNLQFQENGGNGLIQLWEFSNCFTNEKGRVTVSVYNTLDHDWFMHDSYSFSFCYSF